MSEPTYYVRVHGKVAGPYDLPRLQAMCRLGQLARFHEVSEDGRTWMTASSLAELFPAPPPRPARSDPARTSDPPVEEPVEVPIAAPTPTGQAGTDPRSWYYAHKQEMIGPIAAAELQDLIARGVVAPDALAWTEGMAAWTPCHQTGAFDCPWVPAGPAPAPLAGHAEPARQPGAVAPAAATERVPPAPAPGWAVASLILGITGWTCGIGSLLAVVFGVLALARIARSPDPMEGKGLAIAGLILGAFGLLLDIAAILILTGWQD
jgi:hypothetical protein